MRILYITDALAVWGGIERVLSNKMNYLVEHYGYDVYVITTNQGKHVAPYPLDNRIHACDLNIQFHHQYRYCGLKRILVYTKLNRLFLKRLKAAINEIEPDLMICIRMEFVGLIRKADKRIPLVYESHSMCNSYLYEKLSLLRRIRQYFDRRSVNRADCVVSLTNGDADDWRRYNDNVYVIPNLVNFNPLGKHSGLRSKNVIFVGRFSEQKDVWSLLSIWQLVHQRHPEWKLNIYGEGALKNNFLEVIKDEDLNIEVFPPTDEILDRYLECSLLIMTSRYEPFGLVLPEAMSCGLPVIAFDCPYGPGAIISDGYDGFLIGKYSKELFAERICQLIEDDSLRLYMGTNAVSSAKRYKSDSVMLQWKQLLERYSC